MESFEKPQEPHLDSSAHDGFELAPNTDYSVYLKGPDGRTTMFFPTAINHHPDGSATVRVQNIEGEVREIPATPEYLRQINAA